MDEFLSGAMMMGSAVAGLFFLRFYRQTHDRLFALFGAAFWILALNRMVVAATNLPNEVQPIFYVIRLAAFLLILAAIIDKNRSRR